MIFYICITKDEKALISPLQGSFQEKCEVLLPGLPLSFAQAVLRQIKDAKTINSLKGEIMRLLGKEPGLASMTWRWEIKDSVDWSLNKIRNGQSIREDFLTRTEGRLLAKADLQRLAEECNLTDEEVLKLCQEAVLRGWAEWLPAVTKEQGSWQCQRCGETQVEEWTSLYGPTATCPACSALGALSSLHALYRSAVSAVKRDRFSLIQDKQAEPIEITFSPHWEFSDAQRLAANEVLEFIKIPCTKSPDPKRSSHWYSPIIKRFPFDIKTPADEKYAKQQVLLWAACGAGKTEVCFPAAAWALEQGKKVLFAAPRQDVVLDVAPRLERDFPGLETMVLTGVSPERFGIAPFVLATTHQILRFYQAFDLIFLDEMDAFPYHGSSALARGVRQALKPEGKLVYLTATPTPESLKELKEGKLELIRLPARHHRQQVPVPEWQKVSGGLAPEHFSKNLGAKKVFHLVESLAALGPVLLFVPKISWVKPWVELLQKEFPRWQISGSYSADPQRRDKIEKLRQKGFQVFVSTSILERGVTIADAQVIVLEADHEVFDERALVQMAGRVGRTRENPDGTAIFLARRKTPAIEKAINWIEEQNIIAKAQGLID